MASSMLTKVFTAASIAGYLFLASVPAQTGASAAARFRPPHERHEEIARFVSSTPPREPDSDRFRPPIDPREPSPNPRFRPPGTPEPREPSPDPRFRPPGVPEPREASPEPRFRPPGTPEAREASPEPRFRPPHPRAVDVPAELTKRAKTNANSKRCKAKVSSSSSASASKTSSAAHGRVTVSVPGVTVGTGGNSNSGPQAPPTHYSPKLGLVFGGDPSQLSNYGAHQNRFLYNWAVDPPYNYKSLGFNFMPMLWGEKNVQGGCQYNGGCFSSVKASDYNTVMFINEANEPGQANMGVGRAVQLWHQYMQPLANQGVKTVGPVMSSNPNGKVWTKSFYAQCHGCSVTYQPVHYYDVTASGMIQYIKDYHELSGNKPVMVTEWACQNYNNGAQCTQSEIWAFNKEVLAFMDSTSWVVAYMPFGVMMGPLPDNVNQMNILMNGSGKPTALAHLMGY